MKHLLPYFFPTTVALIDDDELFLNSLKLRLEAEDNFCQTFSQPLVALQKLAQYSSMARDNVLNNLREEDIQEANKLVTSFDLTKIYQLMYHAKRFAEVGVLVIDYTMPKMKGLELCEKLNHLPYKKILLTGDADQNLAVEAFNKGIIDRYIKKNADQDVVLLQYICELQQEYFYNVTRDGMALIEKKAPYLRDSLFLELFEKTLRAKNCREYYLIEPSGSYLMLDGKGHVHAFIVKSASEIAGYIEFVEENDDIPEEILKCLRAKTHMLFFFGDFNGKNWQDCLYPMEKLSLAEEEVYYAKIENFRSSELKAEKISTWRKYRSE